MIDPNHPPRWWTADEANAVLPRVAEVVGRALDAVARLSQRSAESTEHARGNGHSVPGDEVSVLDAAVAELEADGIVLRDVRQGLVDFPACASDGRGYWLCWLVGEPEVAWWHWPEAGFAGRTSLSSPP